MKVIGFLLTLILILSFTIKGQEIKIGTQTWTSKNLDVSTYRNGDPIPEVQDKETWAILTTGAWCYYQNKTANGTKYGKLYNFYAVKDPRGLAPKGYHIPSDAEWDILFDYLGGDTIAGAKTKSRSGWKDNGNGTNTSGFNALPGGFRINVGTVEPYIYAVFAYVGANGYWWSSSEDNASNAWSRNLLSDYHNLDSDSSIGQNGYSVRCIKD